MNTKTLAMMALTGLVALSLSHTVWAQDASPSAPEMSNPSAPAAAAPDNGSANNVDQGSPDTATGDDDY